MYKNSTVSELVVGKEILDPQSNTFRNIIMRECRNGEYLSNFGFATS